MLQWSISKRPRTLDQVRGCEEVKTYFKNIKKANKPFPAAITMIGETGCGKTTLAQIIAQMLVCENPKPNGDPCCECIECKAIMEEKFNRTVKQIVPAVIKQKAEELGMQQNVLFGQELETFLKMPMMGAKEKVVIIEEAQEFKGDAQKMILKSVEAPREHCHVILTTMVDNGGTMLPKSILGRCQKFTFFPAEPTELMLYMKSVLDEEGMWDKLPRTFKGEGLYAIAKSADGSYRNAIQNLEQCIDMEMFSEEAIRRYFHLTDEAEFYRILLEMLNGDLCDDSFQTIMCGDGNTIASLFALTYKVISDAESFRLFGRMPKVMKHSTILDSIEEDRKKELAAKYGVDYLGKTKKQFIEKFFADPENKEAIEKWYSKDAKFEKIFGFSILKPKDGKVNYFDKDDTYYTEQARAVSSHKNFPYLRDEYTKFAETENLSPSNYKLLVCRVVDTCRKANSGNAPEPTKTHFVETAVPKTQTAPIPSAPEVKETPTVSPTPSAPSFDNMQTVNVAPTREAPTQPTATPTVRRIIRR